MAIEKAGSRSMFWISTPFSQKKATKNNWRGCAIPFFFTFPFPFQLKPRFFYCIICRRRALWPYSSPSLFEGKGCLSTLCSADEWCTLPALQAHCPQRLETGRFNHALSFRFCYWQRWATKRTRGERYRTQEMLLLLSFFVYLILPRFLTHLCQIEMGSHHCHAYH